MVDKHDITTLYRIEGNTCVKYHESANFAEHKTRITKNAKVVYDERKERKTKRLLVKLLSQIRPNVGLSLPLR